MSVGVLVVPHLKMEVLTTLGEFIYRGETGKVSNAALQNVLAYIRPELGESIEVFLKMSKSRQAKPCPKIKLATRLEEPKGNLRLKYLKICHKTKHT